MFDQDVIISPQVISSAAGPVQVLQWTNTSTGVTQSYVDIGDGGALTEYMLNIISTSANYIGGAPNLVFLVQQAGDNGSGAPGTWINSTQNIDGALDTAGLRAIGWFQYHRFFRVVATFRGALASGGSGNSSSLSAQGFSSSSSGGGEFITIQGGLVPTYTAG
jgi:hypothetical protein